MECEGGRGRGGRFGALTVCISLVLLIDHHVFSSNPLDSWLGRGWGRRPGGRGWRPRGRMKMEEGGGDDLQRVELAIGCGAPDLAKPKPHGCPSQSSLACPFKQRTLHQPLFLLH